MTITRVRYRERQRLTAGDLRLEQAHRLGMAGRHHLGPHTWGVVRGLRVLRLGGDRFRLTRGVAIDGYGRELLVPAPVDFTIEGFGRQQCHFVQLHYCEDPEQFPERSCKDDPAPRIRQRATIRITDTFFPPNDPADPATAHAAGNVAGALPWPVLVARIGDGCPGYKVKSGLIDYSEVPYVGARAAAIRSPTDNARLQLGLTGRTDVHHFLVSTRDAARKLEKRAGIDRDGTLHVWKQLIVTGATATGMASIGGGLRLKISMPMPAGLGHTMQLNGQVDPNLRTLSASLLAWSRSAIGAPVAVASHAALKSRVAVLPFSPIHSAFVSVQDVSRVGRPEVPFSQVRRRFHTAARRLLAHVEPSTDLNVAFSMQLSATGGVLSTRRATVFHPATTLEADPLLREIHAVVTSKDTDPVPRTELRIVGGGADDSDASGRVSIGAQAGTDYIPALRVDGGGRVRILSAPQVATPSPLVVVKGTVYLPPVGKNDPMLPDLLALAFISGHFQIGNVATNPSIELKERSTPDHTYDLKVSGQGTATFSVKRTLELIFVDPTAGPAGMTVRSLTGVGIPANGTPTTTLVTVPGLAPPGRKVLIAVVMLVEASNKTRVVRSNTLPLEIPT